MLEEEAQRRLEKNHALCKLLEIGPYGKAGVDGGSSAAAAAEPVLNQLSRAQRKQYAEIAALAAKANKLANEQVRHQRARATELAVAAVRRENGDEALPAPTALGVWCKELNAACDNLCNEADGDDGGQGHVVYGEVDGADCNVGIGIPCVGTTATPPSPPRAGAPRAAESAVAGVRVRLPKTVLCTSCTLSAPQWQQQLRTSVEELAFATMLDSRCVQIVINGPVKSRR